MNKNIYESPNTEIVEIVDTITTSDNTGILTPPHEW